MVPILVYSCHEIRNGFEVFKVIIKRPTLELVHYLKETSR
jgi:hypothetical protein